MITEDIIKEQILQLEIEKSELQGKHESMARVEQARQQTFQQAVIANQNRYQQISGAIEQLKKLLQETSTKERTNNDNSTPTPDRIDRSADVRAGLQPQGR